ncbi:uncharacterized protein UTRI_02124_B [Ustilago trichophora]|uniref:Methyltransferase type 11 domain-containing protein n=1 Tax=Ustilago trichophora TaxID=86804 RepID=A0A5C3DYE5_9BASI|nr:uncharacterized protein UTRI_02124_B [Ustilago trichophora]
MTGTSRPHKAPSAGLSYDDLAYSETRFTTDPREVCGFEWLSSSTSLVSLLPSSVLLRSPPIRVLHIGVGTSKLSLDLLRYWRQHSPADWKERAKQVVNVDFSPKSVAFQRNTERDFLQEIGEDGEEKLMQYHVLNLLDWSEVRTMLKAKGDEGGFDVVLDKSTTDSISTGEDVPFSSLAASKAAKYHPDLVELGRTSFEKQDQGVATTQILGVHLGAVVQKGGIWLCHSYSSHRWEDVMDQDARSAWPWKEMNKTPVPVESSDPNAPVLNHYIYTLHRV